MELLTKSKDPSWERVVELYVDKCEGISESIGNLDRYKILVVDEGSLSIEYNETKRVVSAPALILLTDEEVSFSAGKGLVTSTVYFSSTEIRDEFTKERIASGEFENQYGKTIYQDYLLIKSFEKINCLVNVLPLSISSYSKLSKIVNSISIELDIQGDGFWPCRSRSYLLELLSFICYVCKEASTNTINDVVNDDLVNKVILYFSEHIGDKIALVDVIKEFGVNRNKLNQNFIKETSMTCFNYLTMMRINLAQIMLAETELPIVEIADRVGYGDSNYFVKVFKKSTGITPSSYRDNFQK